MSDTKNHVDTLVAKAADAKTADDAMKFSQAALNVAHAQQTLVRKRIDEKQVADG
jgi:cellobiose-specific phosphotransferase system component IIA